MQNDDGTTVDLYIPRKCSATNRLIQAKDHGSVQINIAHVDPNGTYTGAYTTVALCGFIRQGGAGDSALSRIWEEKQRNELKGQ